MPNRRGFHPWITLSTALIVGCATAPNYQPFKLSPNYQLVEKQEIPASSSDDGNEVNNVRQVTFSPHNALVLSGGGANGAFTAGVLNGWTASGARPNFDVVTGISTGALIAPFAFVESETDEELAKGYTGLSDSDIYV